MDKSKKEKLDELDMLLSGKTFKKLSGIPKKCYKYALTAVFINYCFGRNLTKGQFDNYEWVYQIKNEPKNFNSPEILKNIQQIVEASLQKSTFHNFKDYKTIDEIINFFRKLVATTKKYGTCLINISEIEVLFDVNKVFNSSHPNIQPHHWVDIDFVDGIIITVPEFFTYVDIVNTWNILLDKIEEYSANMSDLNIPYIDKKNKIENRKVKYEIDTLSRILWVSSVTFVESYLYYIFYNLKQSGYKAKNNTAEKVLELQKVEDEEIIKRLLLPEFMSTKNKEIENKIKKYLEINSRRNRFIHPSAFRSSSDTPELLPLVTINMNEVITTINTCTKLVKLIDDILPEKIKILVWWDRVKHPNFTEYEKGEITNPNSKLSTIKYNDDYYNR